MGLNDVARKFKSSKPKPIALEVHDQLVDAIINGSLRAGEKIVEAELAKALGISRQPIREAFHLLQLQGFIDLFPYRGALIKEITSKEVQDTLEIKMIIEGHATGICAQKLSEAEHSELRDILAEMELRVGKKKLLDILESNSRFHMKIVKVLNNEKLTRYHESIITSSIRFFTLSFSESTNWDISLREHQEILSQIRRRDDRAAKEAAEQHVRNTKERVLSSLTRKDQT